MPVRQPRQAREALIGEDFVLAAQHRPGGRPAALAERGVDLGEQADIGRGVAPREGTRGPGAATVADVPGRAVLGHQPGELRPRQPRHLREVRLHRALVRFAQRRVVELHQGAPDELVGRCPVGEGEIYRLVALGDAPYLLQGLNSLGL